MKKLFILLLLSINAYSSSQIISSAGIEYLNCGNYEIKGLLGKDPQSSTFYLNVYPKTKRQYKITLAGMIPPVFHRYAGKMHVIASGNIKKEGRASNTIFSLDKKLEVLNPNEKFKNVIIKKKSFPCEK